MSKISQEEFIKFSQNFEECLTAADNNQLAIDGVKLRELVLHNRDATWGFVELYCFVAQEKPAYIMTAFIVAIAFEVVFKDDRLQKMVWARAKELGITEYLMDIKTSL